jgi:hypothetical protein
MRWRSGALVALACASACAARAPARAAPAPHPPAARATAAAEARAPSNAGPATRHHPSSADLVVARALAKVARLRDLRPKAPVRGRFISREEMVARVRKELHAEVPAEVFRAQSEMLFALGTVPDDFDYEKSLLDLMTAELAGFYEPKDKTMYMASDLSGTEREATLDHELVHALQDQYWDLGKRFDYRVDAGDEQDAQHALAEGDATSAMLDAILAPQGEHATDLPDDVLRLEAEGSIELSPSVAHVPDILKRSVVAPYIDGSRLVNWARRRGGWAAVDAIWRNPPTTTEQMLHPAKLLQREPALHVPVPSAPKGGPSQDIYHDIEGEETVRILFEGWMPERSAVRDAEGWGGDRLVVFRGGQRFALAWHLRSDDLVSARHTFLGFVRGVLKARHVALTMPFVEAKNARLAARSRRVCSERTDGGPIAVVLDGLDVSLVAGPYVRAADGRPQSAGGCAQALHWAERVARQTPGHI